MEEAEQPAAAPALPMKDAPKAGYEAFGVAEAPSTENLIDGLRRALRSKRECVLNVCRSTEAEADAVVQALQAEGDASNARLTVLRKSDTQDSAVSLDVLVRQLPSESHQLELRCAVIGNVDSGKSTLVGVLTRTILDDGRGAARSKVFRHAHEQETGRTSSIGLHCMCFDVAGKVLNDPSFRSDVASQAVADAAKLISLVDLAGHERYFKTTAFGLTGHLPDYACVLVGANAGLVGMVKEHLGIALALKLPAFYVITKIDMAPEHILKQTVTELTTVLKKPGVRKRPFIVRSDADVYMASRAIASDRIAPIFLVSAVDGRGLGRLRAFLNALPPRMEWGAQEDKGVEFVIDDTFSVPGVGTVVAGTLKQGIIRENQRLLLGPDIGDGKFYATAVKSIHYKRIPVAQVVAGQTAALALKKVKRSAVRKGMVLADASLQPQATWEFDAEIAILTHSTTIQPRYQAVVHSGIIRQAATVVRMDRDLLRSGDRACVRFRFLLRPEYVRPGARLFFREGRTKGIGVVLSQPQVESSTSGGGSG